MLEKSSQKLLSLACQALERQSWVWFFAFVFWQGLSLKLSCIRLSRWRHLRDNPYWIWKIVFAKMSENFWWQNIQIYAERLSHCRVVQLNFCQSVFSRWSCQWPLAPQMTTSWRRGEAESRMTVTLTVTTCEHEISNCSHRLEERKQQQQKNGNSTSVSAKTSKS